MSLGVEGTGREPGEIEGAPGVRIHAVSAPVPVDVAPGLNAVLVSEPIQPAAQCQGLRAIQCRAAKLKISVVGEADGGNAEIDRIA